MTALELDEAHFFGCQNFTSFITRGIHTHTVTMKRQTLAILFALIIYHPTQVRAFASTENQNRRLLNVFAADNNDEHNVVDAAHWSTTVRNRDVISRKSRDRTKCNSRSLTETEVMTTCDKGKPCPDPTDDDWIQDRCEVIFATIGTIWAYVTSYHHFIPVVSHIHEIMTYLSMKIQKIVQSIFADTIHLKTYVQTSFHGI